MTDRDRLSVRQICFMLICYNAVTKLLLYPAFMAAEAGNALIFPALFDLALQTAVVWATAYLSSRTGKSLYALAEGALGRVAAKVVYALLGAYFLFCAVVPLVEQQNFIHDAFYETILSLGMFLPVFAFLFYAGIKPLKDVGAFADVCMPVFVVSIGIIWVMTAGQGDYSHLLPVLRQPAGVLGRGIIYSFYRFSESAFVLIFMGNFTYRKGDAAKMTLSYALGGLIVAATMAMFYAVYGPLARTRTFAIINSTLFFPATEYLGRIDLIAAYALDIVVLFALALHVQAFTHCMCKVFGRTDINYVFSGAANVLLLAVVLLVHNKYSPLQQIAAGWFFIPVALFSYALPLAAWLLPRGNRGRTLSRGGRKCLARAEFNGGGASQTSAKSGRGARDDGKRATARPQIAGGEEDAGKKRAKKAEEGV